MPVLNRFFFFAARLGGTGGAPRPAACRRGCVGEYERVPLGGGAWPAPSPNGAGAGASDGPRCP